MQVKCLVTIVIPLSRLAFASGDCFLHHQRPRFGPVDLEMRPRSPAFEDKLFLACLVR